VPGLLSHHLTFWALLAMPGIFMLATQTDLMELTASTGTVSARLIILALAITPLMRLTNGALWVRFLLLRRRAIGVAAFGYALLHLIVYLLDMGIAAALLELPLPAIWTGWVGFILLLAPAAISNAASQRWLKRHWKSLQRFVYFAALFGLVHWLLVHDSRVAALAHAVPLMLLQLSRIFPLKKVTPHV
jgi:methionine sulfoxide reductase heme-binding subunit